MPQIIPGMTQAVTDGEINDRWIKIRPASGLNLHFREWTGSKTPFVLVHGLSSNCRTWEMVARQLATAGHRVITVDQRGHGLSDKPDGGYDFVTIAEDLLCLLDLLQLENPILAGQSWGGNVMLEFGALFPGRASHFWFVDGGFLDLQARSDATWESISQLLRPPSLLGMPRENLKQRMSNAHPDWSEEGIEATLANFETLPDGTIRPWLSLERHLLILRAIWEQRPTQLYPLLQESVSIAVAVDSVDPERMERKQREVATAQQLLYQSHIHWFERTDHDIHVHRPLELARLMLDR